jgi:cytochrome c5
MTKTHSIETVLLYVVCALALMAGVVKADAADLEKGRTVFEEVAGLGCAGCHGEYGEGDLGVGPFIRGASDGMIRAAIEGIGAMGIIKAMIQPDEIPAVVEYVNYLGSLQVARTIAKRGRFLPGEFSARPGTALQIIINNTSTQPHTFHSDDMDIQAITIAPRSTGSVVWKSAAQAGQYALYCIDCKLQGQFYRINLDEGAKKFHAVAVASSDAGADM